MMRVEILLLSEAKRKCLWDCLSSGLGGIVAGQKKKKSRQNVRIVRIILSRNSYAVNRSAPVAVSKSYSSSLGTGSWWCCVLNHRSEGLVWFTRVPSWLQIDIVYVAISVCGRNFKTAEHESVCMETAMDKRVCLAISPFPQLQTKGLGWLLATLQCKALLLERNIHNSKNMEKLSWCLPRAFTLMDRFPWYWKVLCLLPKRKVNTSSAINCLIYKEDLPAGCGSALWHKAFGRSQPKSNWIEGPFHEVEPISDMEPGTR